MILRFRAARFCKLIDAVKDHVPGYSARFLKKALEQNICKVNGKVERFASTSLQPGDRVELVQDFAAVREESVILHEDEDLFVIAKAPQTVCTDGEMQKQFSRRIYLAHRLDKDTTGVLLFGKSPLVAQELQGLFKNRAMQKEYLAIVDGRVAQGEMDLESFLVRKSSFQGQVVWGSSPQGLWAKTKVCVMARSSQATLVRCFPETGRTHQIRVHLSERGHPLLIDRQYGKNFRSTYLAKRPLLHAHRLQMEWKGRHFEWIAPLPQDFQDACQTLQLAF